MSWPVVRLHVRPSGERLPLLVDRATGTPLPLPTLYVLTTLRTRAANTIAQHLAAVQVLLLWCRSAGVSLDDRVTSGALFRAHELDALWDATARPIAHFDQKIAARGRPPPKVVKLGEAAAALARDTIGNRRRAIRRYLAWLSERRLFALGHQPDAQQTYRVAREELLRSLDARSTRDGRDGDPRQGLDEAERRTLLDVIDPASEANPWKNDAVRGRNLLMITLLLQLGLRRGELLALRVEDVDLQRGQIRLHRYPRFARDYGRARQMQAFVMQDRSVNLVLSTGPGGHRQADKVLARMRQRMAVLSAKAWDVDARPEAAASPLPVGERSGEGS